MGSYDILGRFYDDIVGDQVESAMELRRLIKQHFPDARSILELACGTGAYLAYLSDYYQVEGLDISSVMLAAARRKVPDVPLYQNDMLEFEFDRSYDAVICTGDSLNHLLELTEWEKLFSKAADHLNEDGIFIFDVNTKYKLEKLSQSPPKVHEFKVNILISNVYCTGADLYEWHIKLFEQIEGKKYLLHEEVLEEKTFSVDQIKQSLSERFKNTITYDLERGEVTDKSERIHFVASRK